MDDHIVSVNMDSTLIPENTFILKVEEDQEDSFIEDKVYISETTVTIDNVELQAPIWYDKIKQYDESTSLDRTELESYEVTEIQNDNFKIREGTDIKIEFNNRILYCEDCQAYYEDYCIKCEMLVNILNRNSLNNADCEAQESIPNNILEIQDCFGQIGIYALRIIPAGVNFGPFIGLGTAKCPWEIKGEKFVLDKNKSKYLNWMQYINPTRNISEQNLQVFQCDDKVYYQSTRKIETGDELLVYFGEEYGDSPDKNVEVDFIMKHTMKDIFACTLCSLGFSSKLHLAKHKTICLGEASGKFSIEELTQCEFCKIHLDLKEYFEHHMTFCSERNDRKCILPILLNGTAVVNGPKQGLRRICKHEHYRPKYKVDHENDTNQYYTANMYKCGICNKRYNTKISFKLHMENTHHHSVSGEEIHQHSTTNFVNALIKQSDLLGQMKCFKCSFCGFQTKYKSSLRNHIKTKHLEEFNFKCDKCEFLTNQKHNLELHVKSKHSKKFDYKCVQCKFRTNQERYLEIHVKSEHLKEFDYKCVKCNFRTNRKHHLELHVKSKHLKEFDYKCVQCKFRTNQKCHLELHTKSKHLKEFDYRCVQCKFRTNQKYRLGPVFPTPIKTPVSVIID